MEDENLILSIPTFGDADDTWAWHFEEKGFFTVKSAYKLKCQPEEAASNGQTQSLDPNEKGHEPRTYLSSL